MFRGADESIRFFEATYFAGLSKAEISEE